MANDELDNLRLAMDVLNRRLAAVLHERAALVRHIAAWKRRRGLTIADPDREAEMLGGVTATVDPAGFSVDSLRRIFAAVFAESRALADRG
ncbi:MAG: chorismate mutase [Planctomycetes bacterium]|nr:chorismate mutase [Planctomycetota bacterium]